MGVKNIFKRYELKFMLTTQQYINNPKPIKHEAPTHFRVGAVFLNKEIVLIINIFLRQQQ